MLYCQSSVFFGGKEVGGVQGREGIQLLTACCMNLSFSLLVPPTWKTPSLLPDGSRLRSAVSVGWITCNAEGFAGETGAVDVLEGGERDTNDLLSCTHYPLKGLAGRMRCRRHTTQ